MPWRAIGNSSSHLQELRGSASSTPDLTHSAGVLPRAEPWGTTGCSQPLCCPRASRALSPCHCHSWTLPRNTNTVWTPGHREKHHSWWGQEGQSQLCAEFRLHWVPILPAQSSTLCLRLGTNRDTPRRPGPHAASANWNRGPEPLTGFRSFMGSWAPFYMSKKSALVITVIRAKRILLESASFLQVCSPLL